MTVEKLLIIQKDSNYFLYETIQVLENHAKDLKNFELTIIVDEEALKNTSDNILSLKKYFITDNSTVLNQSFDLSVNLSICDEGLELHGKIAATRKIGPYSREGELIVDNYWSTYLLTYKNKAPFLTFHLQDIFKNILGLHRTQSHRHHSSSFNRIAYSTFNTTFFSAVEQEKFIKGLTSLLPGIEILDLDEVDPIEDLSKTLYIGPAHLESLKICNSGANGIFLTSHFAGFNLLPYEGIKLLVSSKGHQFEAKSLLNIFESEFRETLKVESAFALYRCRKDLFQGNFLSAFKNTDENYPFYQMHVVLWNFLLNLASVNLNILRCSPKQINLLKTEFAVLTKLDRFHEYAMVSANKIHNEARANETNVDVINGHIKNLIEIDNTLEQLAASQQYLRPLLDFYKIKKSQPFGENLIEQTQSIFLSYAEEHQAIKALIELFSVTLRKNEVSI